MTIDGPTPAQQEVLRLALRGLSETTIAERLPRSWQEVQTQMKAIHEHVGVQTRAKASVRLTEQRIDTYR